MKTVPVSFISARNAPFPLAFRSIHPRRPHRVAGVGDDHYRRSSIYGRKDEEGSPVTEGEEAPYNGFRDFP